MCLEATPPSHFSLSQADRSSLNERPWRSTRGSGRQQWPFYTTIGSIGAPPLHLRTPQTSARQSTQAHTHAHGQESERKQNTSNTASGSNGTHSMMMRLQQLRPGANRRHGTGGDRRAVMVRAAAAPALQENPAVEAQQAAPPSPYGRALLLQGKAACCELSFRSVGWGCCKQGFLCSGSGRAHGGGRPSRTPPSTGALASAGRNSSGCCCR